MNKSSSRRWRQVYALVLLLLAAEIIAFYFLTEYYR
jgi:hypothetical protein